jgi:hypothetical protein
VVDEEDDDEDDDPDARAQEGVKVLLVGQRITSSSKI